MIPSSSVGNVMPDGRSHDTVGYVGLGPEFGVTSVFGVQSLQSERGSFLSSDSFCRNASTDADRSSASASFVQNVSTSSGTTGTFPRPHLDSAGLAASVIVDVPLTLPSPKLNHDLGK